jgi:hypothetical protein
MTNRSYKPVEVPQEILERFKKLPPSPETWAEYRAKRRTK